MALRTGSWVFPRVGSNGMPFDYVFHTRFVHKIRNSLPFPLIDETLFKHSEDKPLDLYKQVFPQQLPHWSLAIIGAVQPNGGIYALFEMQSRWYAMLMTGNCQFPTHDHIMADILAEKQRRKTVYYDSPRNDLGVNWLSYMDDIADIIGVKPDIQKYLLSDTKLFVSEFNNESGLVSKVQYLRSH
jgi:hypothetical protein